MPGPGLHHLIAERLAANIQKGTGLGNLSKEDYEKLQQLIADPKNLPYLFFGCQGPDFQLFNGNDINPTLGKLVTAYQDVIDFIEEFKATLLKAVPQPVLDALAAFDEAVDEVIEDSALLSELKQTFDDLNRLLDGFLATLTEMVKKFITDFNVYGLLSHPYRDGVASDEKWWWLDAQHYRKTGKFTEAMLDATRDLSSPNHLYALGYLTHVAADTVGHPYVNIVSGGPFRSHSQRHKTSENYQDVFNWRNVVTDPARKDFNRSQLHAQYNFNFDGNVGAPGEDIPDPFTQLPDGLAQFIADNINRVYQEDADPQVEYGSRVTAERLTTPTAFTTAGGGARPRAGRSRLQSLIRSRRSCARSGRKRSIISEKPGISWTTRSIRRATRASSRSSSSWPVLSSLQRKRRRRSQTVLPAH